MIVIVLGIIAGLLAIIFLILHQRRAHSPNTPQELKNLIKEQRIFVDNFYVLLTISNPPADLSDFLCRLTRLVEEPGDKLLSVFTWLSQQPEDESYSLWEHRIGTDTAKLPEKAQAHLSKIFFSAQQIILIKLSEAETEQHTNLDFNVMTRAVHTRSADAASGEFS